MSAYMLWLNASREKIKSDHPGISITDLSKKAGEIWKGMSKEKKEVGGGREQEWRAGAGRDLWPAGGTVGVAGLVAEGPACRDRASCVGFCLHQKDSLLISLCLTRCVKQEWDRKAEDARREYEKAMKEYEGGRGESSRR